MTNEAVATDLIGSVRRALASFKIPLAPDVFFFGGALPRGATGKILKKEIRKQCDPALQKKPTASKL